MKPLQLGQFYDRHAVHDVFDPFSRFTKQAGTWGLQGIIPLTYTKSSATSKDYVFFVTFGQSQGQHQFVEGISKDGILTWQSQPKQSLQDAMIQDFIQHDPSKNTIHLFLRKSKGMLYQYLGRLGYQSHDPASSQPVHFLWQLLDWDEELIAQIDFPLVDSILAPPPSEPRKPSRQTAQSRPLQTKMWQFRDVDWTQIYLVQQNRPEFSPEKNPPHRFAAGTNELTKPRNLNFKEQDERHADLGALGEKIILQLEQDRLSKANRIDLAERVYRTCERQGNTAPFDLYSFENDETPRLIEVKTTQQGAQTPFYISAQEYEFAQAHIDHYWLYRVYDLDLESRVANYFVLSGREVLELEKEPIQYLVRVRA